MKTPNLLDVPKDSPTRKERIEDFKKRHGIWTYHCYTPPEAPWDAMLVPKAAESLKGYGVKPTDEPMEMIAGYCRLLDEWNLLVSGKTEREAIRTLCEHNGIPCEL